MISRDTVLVLSQDYELFFHRSGTIERCLFEPCEALLASARRHGFRITFYVDVGMLLRMRALAPQHRHLGAQADRVRRHLETLVREGHELGLHVHPHWDDSRYADGEWSFAGTRYSLREFPPDEAAELVRRYARALAEAGGAAPASYRAGGFCVEPWDRAAGALADCGIDVDSSVVPGAYLDDPEKGFDFRGVPGTAAWRFATSPSVAEPAGGFIEIPITPQKLPFGYYWGRLAERLAGRRRGRPFGDGMAKPIGRAEVLRRLAGASRQAELSVDEPKALTLPKLAASGPPVALWHVMGHPKNLSRRSLELFEQTIRARGITRFETVADAARRIRAGSP
jgi:hypothetical protein